MTAITFVILVFIFFALCISMSWVIVFSYRFTEVLESHLDRSRFVAGNRQIFSSASLRGKVIRSGIIAMLFLCPKLLEKRGLIEKNELLNVPAHLKKKLLATWITSWIVFFAFVLLGLWTKFNYSAAV